MVHACRGFIVVLALGTLACSDGFTGMSAPPLGERRSTLHEAPRGRVVACTRRAVASDSAAIGPSGGVLRVGNNALHIPAGALLETVMIRGEVPSDTIASIRLSPEGLRFRKTAGLVLDAEGCRDVGEGAKLLYLDESGSVIEAIDAVYVPRWKRVAAPIHHFSRYALGV